MYGTKGWDDEGRRAQQVDRSLRMEMQAGKLKVPTSTRKKYETGLRSIKYYDNWGQPIDTIKLW